MGNDLWVTDENIVHQASIVGVERPDLEGFAGGFHALGHPGDLRFQAVFLDGSEVFAVHLDPLGIGEMSADDAVDEVLEVVESVSFVPNDGLALTGMDLKAWPVRSLLELDRSREPEVPEHGIENLRC